RCSHRRSLLRGLHRAPVGSCFIGVRHSEEWSYVTSTGVLPLRPPGGENVLRGVNVPVVGRAALLTSPRADVQGLGTVQSSARRAHLGCWSEPVDTSERPPIPSRLVLQHRHKLAPSSIVHRLRESGT